MSTWVHTTIVVPDAYAEAARQLAASLAEGSAGENMFTTPLSADGSLPATHWISSGLIWQEFVDVLQGDTLPADMMAASTVSLDTNPHSLLDELGLKIIQE